MLRVCSIRYVTRVYVFNQFLLEYSGFLGRTTFWGGSAGSVEAWADFSSLSAGSAEPTALTGVVHEGLAFFFSLVFSGEERIMRVEELEKREVEEDRREAIGLMKEEK